MVVGQFSRKNILYTSSIAATTSYHPNRYDKYGKSLYEVEDGLKA